jgi:putative heme degradation protein
MKHQRIAALSICSAWFFALLFVVSPLTAPAQDRSANLNDFLKLGVPQLQAKTAEIIGGSMNFTEAEGKVFWPVYKRYESESHSITDQLVAILKEYEANVKTLTDAKANEIARKVFDIDEQKVRLNRKYYKEFCKVLPATRVLQFFQLMRRIDTLLNMGIASILPMVGENL